MLEVRGLSGGYGGRLIVEDVDIDVAAGEIVTVIGQNGAGKSTILKSIFNMVPERGGQVRLQGTDIFNVSPYSMLTVGLSYIPQHHSIFPRLTIDENLRMGGYLLNDPALLSERMARVKEMFPILKERAGEIAAGLSDSSAGS